MLPKTPQWGSVHQVRCHQVAGWTWPAPAEPNLLPTSTGSTSAKMDPWKYLKETFTASMWQMEEFITVWPQMILVIRRQRSIWLLKVNAGLYWIHSNVGLQKWLHQLWYVHIHPLFLFSHLYCFCVYKQDQKCLMNLFSRGRFLEESLGSSYSSAWLSVCGEYHTLK